jgi:hypothetical protein
LIFAIQLKVCHLSNDKNSTIYASRRQIKIKKPRKRAFENL